MKKISICIPVLNEEKNILIAYEEIKKLFKISISNYEYSVFTDNSSDDESENIIKKILKKINLLST